MEENPEGDNPGEFASVTETKKVDERLGRKSVSQEYGDQAMKTVKSHAVEPTQSAKGGPYTDGKSSTNKFL